MVCMIHFYAICIYSRGLEHQRAHVYSAKKSYLKNLRKIHPLCKTLVGGGGGALRYI